MRSLRLLLLLALGCTVEPIGQDAPPPRETPGAQEPGTPPRQPSFQRLTCDGERLLDQAFAKTIALTFDDGPNAATTPRIYEILKQHDAPATFFINGTRLNTPASRAIAERIARDPTMMLANHSETHRKMTSLSVRERQNEIDATTEKLQALGVTPRYFRFPYGAANCATVQDVLDRSMFVTGWSIDSADWCFAAGHGECRTFDRVAAPNQANMVRHTLAAAQQAGGGILLFHDIHPYTVSQLDAILTGLKRAGYRFARLDDTALLPRLHGITE